jgi:hypothetical protein
VHTRRFCDGGAWLVAWGHAGRGHPYKPNGFCPAHDQVVAYVGRSATHSSNISPEMPKSWFLSGKTKHMACKKAMHNTLTIAAAQNVLIKKMGLSGPTELKTEDFECYIHVFQEGLSEEQE